MSEATSQQHPIRSYVLRKGRITKAQQHALQTYWTEYGIETENRPLDLEAIFGRKAPTVLEIGFGNGEVLAALAEAEPDTNFIGIEVYPPGIGALLNKIKTKALTNVRIIRADAAAVMPQCFADRCLHKILILFPDPWHKKRHHKRRLIQPNFVNMLAAKLCTDGILHLATDWQNYAETMHATITESKLYQKLDASPLRPATAFERRGRALKHRIYELQYRVLNNP